MPLSGFPLDNLICEPPITINKFEILKIFFFILKQGESVDDCGGGYSESIAEMCDELQNGSLPLLIGTPNGREEAGTSRDCFVFNPSAMNASLDQVGGGVKGAIGGGNSGGVAVSGASNNLHTNAFRFLGILMGIAIRSGSPLSLNLAEPMWKLLAGSKLTPNDITEVSNQ